MQDLQNWLETRFRWFHRHPEPGNREHLTTGKIREILDGLGVQVLESGLPTGLVALIPGHGKGPTVALRADIDALPIEEASGLDYASETPGMMHACGHDFHLTALLGAAALLKEETFPGRIKLIFQPAEEGDGGALQVLETGLLEDVKEIYGLHVDPSLPGAVVAILSGPAYAGVGDFRIDITGRGGHAAMPHLCRDPVVAAARIINDVQTLVSRGISPFDSLVVSVTHVEAGTTWNVIPSQALLEGTFRAIDEDTLGKTASRIGEICRAVSLSCEVEAVFSWKQVTCALHNDRTLADLAARRAKALGFQVVPGTPTMGGEDFAYYERRIPGLFFNFGIEGPQPLHHPAFVANPAFLSQASALLAGLARGRLKG